MVVYPLAEEIAESTKLVLETCKVTMELYGAKSLVLDEEETLERFVSTYRKRQGRYPSTEEQDTALWVFEERFERLGRY